MGKSGELIKTRGDECIGKSPDYRPACTGEGESGIRVEEVVNMSDGESPL